MAKENDGGGANETGEKKKRKRKPRGTAGVQLPRTMVKQLNFIAAQRSERTNLTVTAGDVAKELFTTSLSQAYKKALSEEQV